jgi:hypothetical protein
LFRQGEQFPDIFLPKTAVALAQVKSGSRPVFSALPAVFV